MEKIGHILFFDRIVVGIRNSCLEKVFFKGVTPAELYGRKELYL